MTTLPGRDWIVPGVLVALLVGYAAVPLDPVPLRVLYSAIGVLAMAVAFRGVHRHRPAHSRGWVLTLGGFASGTCCGSPRSSTATRPSRRRRTGCTSCPTWCWARAG